MEPDEEMREALRVVLEALETFDKDTQLKILETAETFYGLFKEK